MKGYTVESGYMGYVNGVYMLFASEKDYLDYIENQYESYWNNRRKVFLHIAVCGYYTVKYLRDALMERVYYEKASLH